MSELTIFEVLRRGGFENRAETVFVDNRDKLFKITTTGQTAVETVSIIVSKNVDSLDLSALYEFDLSAEKTNAKPEEIAEIQRWLEIKTFSVTV